VRSPPNCLRQWTPFSSQTCVDPHPNILRASGTLLLIQYPCPSARMTLGPTIVLCAETDSTTLGRSWPAPISTLPPYFLGDDVPYAPPRTELQLNGSGPNYDCQESSHPHQVVTISGRNEILIPDLGADRTWRLGYDDRQGVLSVQGSVTYPPGSGPRHTVFHGSSFPLSASPHSSHSLDRVLMMVLCIHTPPPTTPSLAQAPQYHIDSPAPAGRRPRRQRCR